jgi:membrane associated rhomboid family serine protease
MRALLRDSFQTMGDSGWQRPDEQQAPRMARDYTGPAREGHVYDGQGMGVSAQPEILPPGAMPVESDRRPMPPPRRRRRPGWQLAPATYLLVGINVAVFVLMVLSGVSAISPRADQLLHWGANTGLVRITEDSPVIGVLAGEWWRLVTATFVHAGVIHIGLNMWCLWNLGLLGEPLLGSVGLVATYLLTGVVGNLLAVAVNPGSVGVGASGAVFGIAGVLILLLGSHLLPVARDEVKRLRRSVIYFAVINLVLGVGTNVVHSAVRIDNMAHIGGFLCGLALGVLLVPKLGAESGLWMRRQWLAFGGMLLLVLLGARFVASLRYG